MPKSKLTPGTALTALLEKHGLNYNRLAKAIGISSAMVRLIARDENPVSAPVAFRLAKFFKTTPESWLVMQIDFDVSKAADDKKLAKELKEIPAVDKATFERKKRTAKPAKKGKGAAGKKPAKRGRPAAKKAAKPAVRKPGRPKKTATASASKPTAKRGRPAASSKPAATKPAAKRGRPAAAPRENHAVAENTPPPVSSAETTINEPQI